MSRWISIEHTAGHSYQHLLIKSSPNKYESLFGYLRRLAKNNSYLTPYWLTRLEPALKYRFSVFSRQIVQALMRLVGLDFTEFIHNVVLPTSIEHEGRYYLYDQMRICPQCLKEGGYHQHVWEASYATACPYHQIVLIDECPTCSRILKWDRVHIDYCRCGEDLKEIQTTEASDVLLYYNSLIWRAMGRELPELILPNVPDTYLRIYEEQQLLECLHFIYEISVGKRSFKPNRISEAVERIKTIHAIIDNWPQNFLIFLDKFRSDDDNRTKSSLKQAYDKSYKLLYSATKPKAPNFLLNMFEFYVNEHWHGVIDNRYRHFEAKAGCKYTPISRVIESTHMSRVRMNKIIDLGLIIAERKAKPSGRSFTIIKKCEFIRLVEQTKHMITKYEACSLLGVNKYQFSELVKNRLIQPLVKVGDHRFGTWWCDRREIKTFLDELLQVMPKQAPPEKAASFEQVCQRHLTHRNILFELLLSVLRGETQVAGFCLSEDGVFRLSSVYFDLNEIKKFRKKALKSVNIGYSVPEVASMLNIKQEVAYHLVRNGFIEVYSDPKWPKRGMIVTLEAIVAFENTYVPLTEVAKFLKVCSRSAMFALVGIGLKPAIGGGVDACRQVFYRWENLPIIYQQKKELLEEKIDNETCELKYRLREDLGRKSWSMHRDKNPPLPKLCTLPR